MNFISLHSISFHSFPSIDCLLRPLGRGAPGSIHKLNWFALCFASLIHKFFNSAKTNHSSQLICSFHFYFGFIHCSFRLFCLIAFSFVRSSAAAAALNPPKIKINKTNSFHNSLSPSTIQSRFSWLGMESQRKAGDWVDGWLGCSLRFIAQSAAAGGSSSSLAGCRAAVPPLTHPIQRLFACFASFSIRSGRPSPSTLFFFTSSPIRKSELREKKELNGQPHWLISFTKQKENKTFLFSFLIHQSILLL